MLVWQTVYRNFFVDSVEVHLAVEIRFVKLIILSYLEMWFYFKVTGQSGVYVLPSPRQSLESDIRIMGNELAKCHSSVTAVCSDSSSLSSGVVCCIANQMGQNVNVCKLAYFTCPPASLPSQTCFTGQHKEFHDISPSLLTRTWEDPVHGALHVPSDGVVASGAVWSYCML
jgi:hypothetical protein